MDKLQLALLTEWAGPEGIQGRKRLQKVAYLLQQKGCPIAAEYMLHHYGPYSREVAEVCDVMVVEMLLHEKPGNQYVYTLPDLTKTLLEDARRKLPETVAAFEEYKPKAQELFETEISKLELGSTILYFYLNDREGRDWDRAMKSACEYKGKRPDEPGSAVAFRLAKEYAPVA